MISKGEVIQYKSKVHNTALAGGLEAKKIISDNKLTPDSIILYNNYDINRLLKNPSYFNKQSFYDKVTILGICMKDTYGIHEKEPLMNLVSNKIKESYHTNTLQLINHVSKTFLEINNDYQSFKKEESQSLERKITKLDFEQYTINKYKNSI